jgi:hypothetical protein
MTPVRAQRISCDRRASMEGSIALAPLMRGAARRGQVNDKTPVINETTAAQAVNTETSRACMSPSSCVRRDTSAVAGDLPCWRWVVGLHSWKCQVRPSDPQVFHQSQSLYV